MVEKFLVFVIAALTFIGCDSDSTVDVNESTNSAIRPMRIVIDDLKREILVPTKTTRVISLAPSVTEMIYAAGGGDRLVGVTTFCDYPEEAKYIAKIGDTMNPNIETIVALKPDVVFVSTASQIEAFTKTLEQNGITVYVMNPTTLGDIYQSLKRIAVIFDNYESASKLSHALRRREMDVCEKTDGCLGRDKDEPDRDAVRVFVQISREPLFTVGKTSVLNELIRNAGGLLVTAEIETAYPKLSKETALALNPEAIILSDSDDNREPNEVFKNSPAVKNGRVYRINADILSRPGPRLVDALEQIAKELHPEKFWNK